MYSFLIVAFAVAAFVIMSVLNAGTWGKLAEGKAEILATNILIEHVCRVDPTQCLQGRQADTVNYGYADAPKCTYTKVAYKESTTFLSVLGDRTKNSYFCVGQKKTSNNVDTLRPQNSECPLPLPPQVTQVPAGAVLICNKQ